VVKSGEKGSRIMTITYNEMKTTHRNSIEFLKKNSHVGLELQLLLFWGRHPQAKLSLYSIASALDTARINLRHAIKSLVEKDILVEQENNSGLITYSLNELGEIHENITLLGKLDWSEFKTLERELQEEALASS
jgi:hypothetical protein